MVEVRKKDNETSDGLLRRFNKRMQSGRVLSLARKLRFFGGKKKTRQQKRDEAMYRHRIRERIDKAKKMGHFDDEVLKRIKKDM